MQDRTPEADPDRAMRAWRQGREPRSPTRRPFSQCALGMQAPRVDPVELDPLARPANWLRAEHPDRAAGQRDRADGERGPDLDLAISQAGPPENEGAVRASRQRKVGLPARIDDLADDPEAGRFGQGQVDRPRHPRLT